MSLVPLVVTPMGATSQTKRENFYDAKGGLETIFNMEGPDLMGLPGRQKYARNSA